MKIVSTSLVCVATLAWQVQGQTAPDTEPVTGKHLGVVYGNTEVNANDLIPQPLVQTAPSIYLFSPPSTSLPLKQSYMALLVDQSIPQSSIDSTGPQAPGLEPCRTTRLHWYQTDLTLLTNGTLTPSSSSSVPALATYGGPMPGLNDIAHTYIFYLFTQPPNFSLPAWDADRTYNPISVYARMNFSTSALVSVPGVGEPVAANFMRVRNPDSTAYGTAANGTCPPDFGGSNASGTGQSAPSVEMQSSGAGKVQRAVAWALAVVGMVAFSIL